MWRGVCCSGLQWVAVPDAVCGVLLVWCSVAQCGVVLCHDIRGAMWHGGLPHTSSRAMGVWPRHLCKCDMSICHTHSCVAVCVVAVLQWCCSAIFLAVCGGQRVWLWYLCKCDMSICHTHSCVAVCVVVVLQWCCSAMIRMQMRHVYMSHAHIRVMYNLRKVE